MKKIILLSTAAALLSPLAAKANQKSSILVGVKGSWERTISTNPDTGAEELLKAFDGEDYFSMGLEVFGTYKVAKSLQLGLGVVGQYGFEHTVAETKKAIFGNEGKVPAAWLIEPRVTLGWAFPVSTCTEITPFIGIGIEGTFSKSKNSDNKDVWTSQWNIPGYLGARATFGSVYTSLAARFDLSARDAYAGKKSESKGTYRNLGAELTVGLEF